MKRGVLTVLFGFYCAFVFSQTDFTFSRFFQTSKKSIPLAILNNHEGYFHLLRYNKLAHDFIVERRAKPTAEIVSFSPLHLDSVNANWFDYEKLDYLFFEKDHKAHFLFKKELNDEQSVYLKTIDTNGKCPGFKQLLSIKKEGNITGLNIAVNLVNNDKILLVTSQLFANGITKKSVSLYQPSKAAIVWTKKLPHETTALEITDGFTVNQQNDLFYIHYKIKSYSVIKRETGNVKLIDGFSDITIFKSRSDSKELTSQITSLVNTEAVYHAVLAPVDKDVVFFAYLVEAQKDNEKEVKISIERYTEEFNKPVYTRKHNLPDSTASQLTFYDGSDFKQAAYKNYKFKDSFWDNNLLEVIAERRDENYYKELIISQVDLLKGDLKGVRIIPRKIFYFNDRTRFKNMGNCMLINKNSGTSAVALENPANFKIGSKAFTFKKFNKQSGLGGILANYKFSKNGDEQKILVFSNKSINLIPLRYSACYSNDDVFYFNSGKTEKFGFTKNL